MDERAVIQQAQEGNTDAFRQLFDDNKNRIFALAYQYAKNVEDAEDILQETFIKAYNNLEKFRLDDETNFTSWLYRIGINCSIDHLRRNKMRKDKYFEAEDLQNEPSSSDFANPERSGQIEEVRKKLDKTLNRLSARQRMVFILRHYQQFTVKEISELLNCSEGSVKKQLFRAFSSIKEEFQSLFSEASYEMQQI